MKGRAPPPGKLQPGAGKNCAGGGELGHCQLFILFALGASRGVPNSTGTGSLQGGLVGTCGLEGAKGLWQLHSHDDGVLPCAEYIPTLSLRTTRAAFPLTGDVGGWDVIASFAPDPAPGPTEPLSGLAIT